MKNSTHLYIVIAPLFLAVTLDISCLQLPTTVATTKKELLIQFFTQEVKKVLGTRASVLMELYPHLSSAKKLQRYIDGFVEKAVQQYGAVNQYEMPLNVIAQNIHKTYLIHYSDIAKITEGTEGQLSASYPPKKTYMLDHNKFLQDLKDSLEKESSAQS